MYKRTCEIIKSIYERPNKFDVRELAQLLNIGIKTVQADIQKIKEFFDSNGLASLGVIDNKFYIRKINNSKYEVLNRPDLRTLKRVS
jgi:transcriptional antiterminator